MENPAQQSYLKVSVLRVCVDSCTALRWHAQMYWPLWCCAQRNTAAHGLAPTHPAAPAVLLPSHPFHPPTVQLPPDASGAVVVKLEPSSEAASHLQVADVIMEVDGVPIAADETVQFRSVCVWVGSACMASGRERRSATAACVGRSHSGVALQLPDCLTHVIITSFAPQMGTQG
jgi:hypothetical protein